MWWKARVGGDSGGGGSRGRGCTKCPLYILRIGKMPHRGWFESVFVWMFISPYLSVSLSFTLSVYVTALPVRRAWGKWWDHCNEKEQASMCECVCMKQIKSRKLYEDRQELQNMWAISVYQCPNCFPLLTWLTTNRTIFSVAVKVTHTQKLTLTPPHFLPHSAITTLSCSSMIGLLLAFVPENNPPKMQQADMIRLKE